MWRWLVLVLAGCGAARHEAVPSNARSGTPSIVVREARDGEIPAKPSAPGEMPSFMPDCKVAGEAARELVEPVLAFAREQLLGKPRERVHTRVILPGEPEPPNIKRGREITITPRTQIGQLEVADWWDGGGASTLYCLHVRHEGDATVVLVSQQWSVISESEPRPIARSVRVASVPASIPASP